MSTKRIGAAFIAAALSTVPVRGAADAAESLNFSDIGGPRRVRTFSVGPDRQPGLAEIASPGSARPWTEIAIIPGRPASGDTAAPESKWSGVLGNPIRVRTFPVMAPDTVEQVVELRGSL